ncbi:MAG: HAMP domain-containing sensor histidine kinase [bacterium]|nr:HAMP domain-containing sensor histidine kinase [bacterium]
MLELVNDLLDVAKLESGKFDIHNQQEDIREIIRERISFFKTSAKASEITVKEFFGINLPEKVNFDPRRIAQVLNNLISNAIKFTPVNGTINIQTLLHKKGRNIEEEAKMANIEWFLKNNEQNIANIPDSLVVVITDSGAGLSSEKIVKLFSKFKQFEAVVREGEQKGIGLGLVVVKDIVNAHGGVTGVASVERVGSTFYFTLPV